MSIPTDFISHLKYEHPEKLIEAHRAGTAPKGGQIWSIGNELRPVDLFCYLAARFGPPNGIQNFLRRDDSDNLIHWDWTLQCDYGWLTIQGMNFRTEVLLRGNFPFDLGDRAAFIAQMKADFGVYGREMSQVRESALESWTEFVNPFQRIKNSVDDLMKEVSSLELDPKSDHAPDYSQSAAADFESSWSSLTTKYSKALGICFGLRAMLPVMAEAFVNMVLFVLLRPEIKQDSRLRGHHIRQPIDIRIRGLHINCLGFANAVDYTHIACKRYQSLVNERNDLLHGNVAVEKLRFNDVYFCGRVPVFESYRSMWERSLGVEIRSIGVDTVNDELRVVTEFIEYVLSCMEPEVRRQMEVILQTRNLGVEKATGQLGILFGERLADIHMGQKK